MRASELGPGVGAVSIVQFWGFIFVGHAWGSAPVNVCKIKSSRFRVSTQSQHIAPIAMRLVKARVIIELQIAQCTQTAAAARFRTHPFLG